MMQAACKTVVVLTLTQTIALQIVVLPLKDMDQAQVVKNLKC